MAAMTDPTPAPPSTPVGAADEVPQSPPRTVDPRLLELLVCPLTKSSLAYDANKQELISRAARLAFPIRDGVPLLTVKAARPLE